MLPRFISRISALVFCPFFLYGSWDCFGIVVANQSISSIIDYWSDSYEAIDFMK